jgi:pyruvate/2-oxoglutarate dehydrogenase complex dihydrolipoamide acyltransferase (E2) component
MVEFCCPMSERAGRAEIIDWLVAPGDQLHEEPADGQISTDKVIVCRRRATWCGTAVHAAPGDVVPVGMVLLTIDEAEAEAEAGVEVEG